VGGTFKTERECRKHQKYHWRKKIKNTLLSQMARNKTDRRTIQGRGTPKGNETLYQNRTQYNMAENKWICNTCNRKYEPRNQQNAIQHACKHFQKKRNSKKLKLVPKNEETEQNYRTRKETIWITNKLGKNEKRKTNNLTSPTGKQNNKTNKKTSGNTYNI